ncbi:MAG: hypothetical protein Kow00108_25700 [Calditrichia bacterium]
MVKSIKIFIVILFFITYAKFSLQAENKSLFFPLQGAVYEYFDFVLNRTNDTTFRFPLQQPYDFSRVRLHSDHEKLVAKISQINKLFVADAVNPFVRVGGKIIMDQGSPVYHEMDGGLSFTTESVTLFTQFSFHRQYKYDRKFAGNLSDADHWIFGRFQEAYLHFHKNHWTFFIGRTNRNWGTLNEYSLILSNNPYSYEHMYFSYEYKKLKYSMLFAQLDTRDELIFKHNASDSIIPAPASRRFFIAHRYAIMFSNNFQIAFTQAATYGGENRQVELAFFNPMNPNFMLQHNERLENDGFLAISVFWKLKKGITLWGQFLGDDIVINNDPGIDAAALYPNRLGLQGAIKISDILLNKSLWSFRYNRIWNRTYQSINTWENYHYREYSLGYPVASSEEFSLKFHLWRYFPLYVKAELNYGRYGNVSLTDYFPMKKEPFPVPKVAKNVIFNLSTKYFYSSRLQFNTELTYRKNPNHYSNRFEEQNRWVVRIGFSYLLNKGFGVN